MLKILDILERIECRELAWARLIMDEILEEAEALQQRVEAGECEMWVVHEMLKRHVVKMSLVSHALHGMEEQVAEAQEMALSSIKAERGGEVWGIVSSFVAATSCRPSRKKRHSCTATGTRYQRFQSCAC